jgi:hypothetical protein
MGGRKRRKKQSEISVLRTAERSGAVGAVGVTTNPNAYDVC